jgi:hypothetical protein
LTSSTSEPAAILAAAGVWTSFRTVSESTPQPPQGRRIRPSPPPTRTSGLTPKQGSIGIEEGTLKKKKKKFLIYKEIQMGSGAKSYIRKGFIIYKEMHKYFHHI